MCSLEAGKNFQMGGGVCENMLKYKYKFINIIFFLLLRYFMGNIEITIRSGNLIFKLLLIYRWGGRVNSGDPCLCVRPGFPKTTTVVIIIVRVHREDKNDAENVNA